MLFHLLCANQDAFNLEIIEGHLEIGLVTVFFSSKV